MNDNLTTPSDDLDYLRQLTSTLMSTLLKGIAMRSKQKEYFRSRDHGDLITCRQLESEFDRSAHEALLFPGTYRGVTGDDPL